MRAIAMCAGFAALVSAHAANESTHSHPPPQKLGTVHFENSCADTVQGELQRAVALLHSFAYESAYQHFAAVATQDHGCALAHWGEAMSRFHQLWIPPPNQQQLKLGQAELRAAQQLGAPTARERELIQAASIYFSDTDPARHAARARAYTQALESVARHFPKDDEAQILYALALLGTAPPTDRSHANQKRAAAILEPIYARQPDHPGAAHYLIHAYDSTELAPRGLAAARAYAKIAPAAPHALHMPSHIFTRLGLWSDSIESNEAARRAARAQGDVGEELHAMDYLTYAYLQHGRDGDAVRVVDDLAAMSSLGTDDFKVGYAATAMPVRLAVERERWADAANLNALPGSPPYVAALAHWARALAHEHSGRMDLAGADIRQIDACESKSRADEDSYWAAQIAVLSKEARAWRANGAGQSDEAVALLEDAADAEDSLENLPVTPGPIVPAREQLGRLLLELHRPQEALRELTVALKDAPGRRAALKAAARAAEGTGNAAAAAEFRRLVSTGR